MWGRHKMFDFLKNQPPSDNAYVPHVMQEEPTYYGHEINLVRMVEEHAPIRINTIDAELASLTEKMRKLEMERAQLERFVAAMQ